MEQILKKVQAAVQQVIWDNAFYGCLLQEINFKLTDRIPRAALSYSKKTETFTVELNPEYYGNETSEHRVSVLLHEILHFTHTHIPRFGEMQIEEKYKPSLMIAADLAINQLIKNLPEDAVTLEFMNKTFNLNLPPLKSMEEYYNLVKDVQDQQEQGKSQGKNGEKITDIETQDSHDWEELSKEELQEMLKEMKNVLTRTVEKAKTYGPSTVPDSIKDLLERIDVQITALDYKRILKNVLKKSLSAVDRDYTWTRPSKRYGEFSPGTKVGQLPKLEVFIDTSGSISITELNEFLAVISGFLKVGGKQCFLGLWHTNLYYHKKYKLNSKLSEDAVQSGGTDVTPVLEKISSTQPNLSVILTDGEFHNDFKGKITSDVLWVISKNGREDHPHRNIGKTIKMAS